MSTHDDAPDSVVGSTDAPQTDAPQNATTVSHGTSSSPYGTAGPSQGAGGAAYGTAGPVPAAPPAEPAPRARLRVATVVWGLVITAIGVMVLATASGVSFDLGLVMIGLIGFAGIALLIGSIASGIRHRHP